MPIAPPPAISVAQTTQSQVEVAAEPSPAGDERIGEWKEHDRYVVLR